MNMKIYGLTKTTLLDYPGLVASTVFTGGCNFRCPFCHNGDLVQAPDSFPLITEDEIFLHLQRRKATLEGICITGGEPTLAPDLLDFLLRLRDFDIKIKLDTNGYRPQVLEKVLEKKLADYVAMDIKAGWANYSKACGIEVDITNISASVRLLSTSDIEYEFRTTCVKGIHTKEDFEDITKRLPGNASYFLQSYEENPAVFDKSCASFTEREIKHFQNILLPHIPNTFIRGI